MEIGLIALLMVISGFCSATETAFSSCNRIRLKNYAESGNKKAKLVLEIEEKFDKALTAILICNNVVNIASSSLATVIFTKYFGAGAVGLATLIMTIVVLIFGEIIPKGLAKEYSENFAMFMSTPLKISMFVLTPLIIVFTAIKNLVSRLMGGSKRSDVMTEEELMYLIEESENGGVLEEQESDLVRSALEFDEIFIKEILVPRINVAACDINDDIENIKSTLVESTFSRIPIYEGSIDNIVGILHERDLLIHYMAGEKDIKSIITKPLYFPEQKLISECLREMQKSKIHMAVVIDEYGGTAGIVTLEDILEELVGEIYDETDAEDTSFISLGNSQYSVSADYPTADFLYNISADKHLIETDQNSLGGWVMSLLERIPDDDEIIENENFTIQVRMADEQKIDRLIITYHPKAEEEQE